MKVKLRITKHGTSLYAGAYDVADADTFGKACADAWSKLRQEQLSKESSIGALMEHLEGHLLDHNGLDQLNGAHISLEKA
jgi:hypothetical protein